jgi:hypothetical protein
MNTTVWKYELVVDDEQTITLPHGAVVLTVQAQHGVPVLWAHVDPMVVFKRDVLIQTRGTGHNAYGVGEYVGTYQLEDGRFVGHVFMKEASDVS